ncbi:MAG TPA: CPBP family glutamic-type intramembrane protease [Ilumatobacteraceae bacterium]|nr:CPBP family glutamic-type intramembrane protease [Ilumatobacteraceae bacterium]
MLPTPTGWFPDPWNAAGVRYWDGRGWTGHVAVPTDEKQPHPTLPIRAAWGAVITLLVSLIAGRYLLKAISSYDWPIAVYVTILAIIGYAPAIAWCWYSSRRWGTGRFRADVGLRARWADAGWGPLTWGACLLTQVFVGLIVTTLKIPFTSNVKEVSDLHNDRGYVVSLLVLAVVAAPICEEIVFRGVILRGFLSRHKPAAAIGLQGLLFGMAHFDPIRGTGNIGLVLVLASVGCTLGTAAYLFRRIAPTMIAHAILNAIAMAIALSGWMPNG